MKNQPVILLVIAVGCGLVAMLGVKQLINKPPAEVVETVQVLSAEVEIQPGVLLDEVNTKFVEIAATSVPAGAVLTREEISDRSLKVPVMPGDWILSSKLGEKGQRGSEVLIPPGMGIVTIPVDATTSHSGMLLPGNRIDLLLTFTDVSSGAARQATITVLEFVEVFAVDNRVYGIDKSGDAMAKNITLLVEPEQGKAVTLATRIGTLSTMMRARGELSSKGGSGISEEFLTRSFMGSNLGGPSAMDVRNEAYDESEHGEGEEQTADLAESEEETPTVDDMLSRELEKKPTKDPGGSGPVAKVETVEKNNVWTMEIYEGEDLRLEEFEIPAVAENKSGISGDWNVWGMWKTK